MLKRILSGLLLTIALSIVASAQEVEVDRYSINARIDTAASAVDVRATLNIQNLSQSPKPKLFLLVSKLAKVSSATVNGASAQVEQSDDRRVTTLSQLAITPQSPVSPGAKATVELSYRIEAPESTASVHIYGGETLLMPESMWVPMPTTMYTLYGPTTAPITLTTSASSQVSNFRALSVGSMKVEGQNAIFEQSQNSLPLLVAGSFDQPVTFDRGGIKVEIFVQPGITAVSANQKSIEPRAIITQLGDEAGRVIDFLTRTLGPPPAGATFRIISSVRAGNITVPGVLVLNEQVFRREKLNAGVIEVLADAIARMWTDGQVKIRGQAARSAQDNRAGAKARSAAFLRDSLPRYLAALYFEDRFGKDAARDLFTRMRWAYTPVAQAGRDAELGLQTLLMPNYNAAVLSKGPLVFRLLAETAGRDKLIAAVKSMIAAGPMKTVTIDDFRSTVSKGSTPDVDKIFQLWIDSIIEPDLIVGAPLPSEKPGTQRVNVRNLGNGEIKVTLLAVTASGKQLRTEVAVPSEDLVSAEIPTSEKIASLEIDPDKLIIQSNYDNDAREGDFKSTRPSSATLLNESIVAFNKSQYAEAEAKLRQATGLDSRDAVLHAWLARTLLAEKKLDEAASEANAAMKVEPPIGPALAWARITLGQVALARNQAADAVRQLRAARVEADEAAAQFAAGEALVQAERAGNITLQVDESVRAFIAALDSAIKQPSSDKLFTMVVRNNLKRFVQGLTVSRPAGWTTEILHADQVDSNRVVLDVSLKVKTEGKDLSGTAEYVLTRIANAWVLEDVPSQLFNVK